MRLPDGACFTYGSLMWAPIMGRASGAPEGSLRARPAWLTGHARHGVHGQDYPGVVVSPEARANSSQAAGPVVQGVLYEGLTPAQLACLDRFEGEEYERVAVAVWCHPPDEAARLRAEPVPAWLYRFRAEFHHRLTSGPWDPQAFEREGMARFLKQYPGF